MNRFDSINKPLLWFLAILLTIFVVACGGNRILGVNTSTLIDLIKPRVTVTVPVDGSTTHPSNAALTAVFTEAMAPATISITSFTLRDTTTSAVVAASSVSYVVASKTAKFTPAAPLTPTDHYTATISTVATDLAGNALAGNQAALPAASNYVWSFIAAAVDNTHPTITLTAPASAGTNVALNASVNATFSEAMDPATICGAANTTATCPVASFTLATSAASPAPVLGAVTYDAMNNIATFTPSSPLASGTSYTATVTTGATDLAALALVAGAVPNPWSFTTGTVLAPSAINLGTAASFGIASQAGLTSTGVAVITGDVALYPTATCTDSTGNLGASQTCLVKTYSSTTGMTVNGSIYWAGDPFDSGATAHQVAIDLNTAWVEGKNKVDTFATGSLLGELGAPGPAGKVLNAGVYHEAALGLAQGNVVTFDAQGDANAIFIIKIDSSFVDSGTLGNPTTVKLANGAQAKNIWFIAGLDITIGQGTIWNGNILAGRTATVNKGSAVVGRILAGASGAGAFTITGAASPVTSITVP